MPSGIKYSTTNPTGGIRKGNVGIGVEGNLGPTSTSGLYSNVTAFSEGTYIIVELTGAGDQPRFYAPPDNTSLIRLANSKGAGVTTADGALTWFAGQSNYLINNTNEFLPIPTSGLALYLDASLASSYPGIGTTWYDLSGNGNNGTLANGVGFSDLNGGILNFDGVDDYVQIPDKNSLKMTTGFTQIIWVKFNNEVLSYYRTLFGKPNYTKYGMIVEWYGSNPILFDFIVGGNRNALGLIYPGIGQWVMLAQSYNSEGADNNQIGYIAGGTSNVITATRSGNVDTDTSPIYIGQEGLAMDVGLAILYNKGLTVSELDNIYSITKSRFGY